MKNTIFLCFCCVIAFITACGVKTQPENWTQFRGPNGQGVSTATNLPVSWGVDENIAWKIEIPGEGWSSPIVWNDHIFLTTTTEEGENCHVIAVDKKTGKILWNNMVFKQEANQRRHPMNSYATPTPVTDGVNVYAVFSGGGFVALDFNGNVKWINDLDFYSQHGKGNSPILYGDLLILPMNHSNREEPLRLGWQMPWDKSYLLALDKNTGRERWRAMRGMTRIAHSTPVVMQVDGKDQIINAVGDAIQGFDPTNGRLIWTVASSGEPSVPTPAIGEGLIFTAPTGGAPIRAVSPTGQGDCTETHIIWEERHPEGATPLMASFLYVKPFLYTCTDRGTFSCIEAATGKLLWQHQLGTGALNPSPLYADGKIYVLSERGTTTVLKPSDDPQKPAEIIATNEIEEMCRASMAVAGNQLIIRSANHLWCIGN